jgi:hypothetical protein
VLVEQLKVQLALPQVFSPGESFDAALQCEIRCHLRADVDEHIRWSPDVASSGMSGFGGHPRTLMALGVGSSSLKDWFWCIGGVCWSLLILLQQATPMHQNTRTSAITDKSYRMLLHRKREDPCTAKEWSYGRSCRHRSAAQKSARAHAHRP